MTTTIKKGSVLSRLSVVVISTILVASLVFQGVAAAFSGSGAGTEGDPYQIANCVQLQEMNDELDAHYILVNDIDCSATTGWNAGAGFAPIMDGHCDNAFTGSLDGDGHSITDLFINLDGVCAGLFGWLHNATISNLSLEDVDIASTDDYVGGLAAYSEGGSTITDVSVTGTTTGESYVGGLAGELGNDSITNSNSTATVNGGGSNVGGLVALFLDGTISNSYATGNVTSDEEYIGGLTGYNEGTIANSYATGNVIGENYVGGLTGANFGTITNSYAVGSVTGDDLVGGLTGEDYDSGITTNSFWDTQTSGQATSDGGTGKTTIQMKNVATFIGWDFATIWDINGTDNQGYPFFQWQIPPSLADGDGVDDAIEDAAPNSGDGNDDGTLDSQQANVVSFVNTVTGEYVALGVDNTCTLTVANSAAEVANTTADSGFDYPAGLLGFTADCGTPGFVATVTQYFYGVSNNNFVLRKYNPNTNAYSHISGAVVTQVTIGGKTVTKAVYQITDGGELDTDNTLNGVIVDPAGLAQNIVGAPNTGLGGKR